MSSIDVNSILVYDPSSMEGAGGISRVMHDLCTDLHTEEYCVYRAFNTSVHELCAESVQNRAYATECIPTPYPGEGSARLASVAGRAIINIRIIRQTLHRLGVRSVLSSYLDFIGFCYIVAGKAAGCLTVASPRGWDIDKGSMSRYNRLMLALSFKLADRVVVISQMHKDLIVSRFGCDPAKIRIIPSAPRLEFWRSSGEPLPKLYDIVAAGHLRHKKGFDILLDAIVKLRDNGFKPAVAIVGGDAGEREALEAMVTENDLGRQIKFVGDVPRVMLRSYFHKASVFVLCSRNEGGPNVLLEAIAAGLPAVATDVGFVREVLGADEYGIVVAPENPAALAGALERLLSDDATLARYREAAQARVAEWSWDQSYPLYKEALSL